MSRMNEASRELEEYHDDGFESVSEGANEWIRGNLVTFVDKEFRRRDGGILNERQLLAVGVKKCWRKFMPEGPVFVGPQENGALCVRSSLGDTDESLWESKFGPNDPWQNARYLYLADLDSGETFTFVTASGGGRHAIEALASQITMRRRLSPGVSPIVKLNWAPWGRQFPKSRPNFVVVEWLTAPSSAPPDQPRLAGPGTVGDILDGMGDEIPF
jgi:hypothetical protein